MQKRDFYSICFHYKHLKDIYPENFPATRLNFYVLKSCLFCRTEQQDVITAPLIFNQPPAVFAQETQAKKATDESLLNKKAWELFDASSCVGQEFRVGFFVEFKEVDICFSCFCGGIS
jgi:hypothetical protein